MTSIRYDVVIVGGGAAGLSAALVLGRAQRRAAVVDAGSPRNAPAAHTPSWAVQWRPVIRPCDRRVEAELVTGSQTLHRWGRDGGRYWIRTSDLADVNRAL